MWHSLRVRLIILFMVVVMVAIGTVALVASLTTSTSLQVYNRAKNNQQIVSTLLTAYHEHESRQALQSLTKELARDSHQRIILCNSDSVVIADSNGTLIGTVLAQPSLPVIMPSGLPSTISTSGGFSSPGAEGGGFGSSAGGGGFDSTTVAGPLYVFTGPATPAPPGQQAVTLGGGSPEDAFLSSVNQSLWLSVFIAGLTALLLALVFAGTLLRPLHTLQAVVGRMESGDLSQRVAVQSSDEIGTLAHAFNAMADSLSRAELLRRNMVSDLAHELRGPLMNIRGSLELLQDRVLEPTPEILASLYEETSLLGRLVADLQDLSLAEAGQLRLARQPISLEEVTSQATQMVQPALAEKCLTLRAEIPADLPQLEADPERLAQILGNLLSNAIRHTPGNGEVSISATTIGSMVQVRVQDTGEGIAPEHLPYLFERFYRIDSSRARATGGTGLGLAIVKQLVQAHGGQITVESRLERGTVFTFTLPAVTSAG